MIDRNKVEENLKNWLGNPSWREYYETAPSEKCREFIEMELYYSECGEEEAGEEMDRIEAELKIPDLRHLMNYAGNNPRKGYLARKIREKEAKGEE